MKIPKYLPGDIILSKLYMGVVQAAFFDDVISDEWNYIIGENASLADVDRDSMGFRVGSKYIDERYVTHVLRNGNWIKEDNERSANP